ncbi:CDP-glycerol glycerophosphotransferase family protein [candidate division WOR-3 bacterium]|nr:CDP-glycerol glycerophosphotransferase family protein [candidate division WOR-3 bacterium]
MTKILFKIGYAYHKAAFDPVIDLMVDDDKYDVFFTLDMERIRKFFLFDVPYQQPIIDEWEKKGYRFTKNTRGFDVVITGDTLKNAADYGKTMLCFLNHGTGIKNILYRELAKVPDHRYQIFVEGPHRVESLQKSGRLGKNEVHIVGLPKLDYYFQGMFSDRTGILSDLGLDPSKKTVVYAPTYKPTSLYDLKDDIFEQTKDYNLIIKLHPYSWMGKYAPHNQHRIYERKMKKYSHAVLLPFESYSIVPYYSVADTLIGEASSTVFDFLALGKFGIVYDLPCDKLNHSDGEPLLEIDNREFLKGAFVHVKSGKDLSIAVERALNPTPDMVRKADEYRQTLFYKLDGNASKRFVQKMEELLKEGGHENNPNEALVN